jgi:AGZA family xanthine/uracil permease-like MFS transporter
MSTRYPLFVKRDLDGFFGLFIDNIVQVLLIVALCGTLCGMHGEHAGLIYGAILPGAAVSILFGNLFYAWQAHRLARREGRDDVTALPYGINTPSLLVYVFFVMVPAYHASGGSATHAWHMGVLACLGSGLIELLGAFVADHIRRHTPRAALLSTLSGIAIGFIAMTFALQIWHRPVVAMAPMAIIMLTYFSKIRLPLGLPGGLVAVALGTTAAWVLPAEWTGVARDSATVAAAWDQRALHLPSFTLWQSLERLFADSGAALTYFSVILPMGLFNVAGSLQNIESAEAAGDRFDTRSSLAVNGLGTIVAASCGSCFPTTIYIGHPGWKDLGARAGYSTLNGIVIAGLCLSGTVAFVNEVVPIDAGIAIVLWIGVVITAQAFQATPRAHAPAVALGLFPAIAAWGATVAAGAFLGSGGRSMQDLLTSETGTNTLINGFLLHGMNLMERGYIFTCMIVAAIAACLIDRRFRQAAVWSAIGAIAAWSGMTHAYQLQGNAVDFLFAFTPPREGHFAFRATAIGWGYVAAGIVFVIFGRHNPKDGNAPAP